MYELKPRSWLGWQFDIERDGASVGSLHLAFFASSATLELSGRRLEMKRDSFFGPIILREGGRTVARAERRSLLRPSFALFLSDRELLVKAEGFLMRTAVVLHGDVVRATIRRISLFRRTFTIETDGAVPEDALLFAVTVMLLVWRSRSRNN